MKIKGGRSYIRVEIEKGKEIVIHGELTMTPEFYADFDSIKKWEPPFDKETITTEDKKSLALRIMSESKDTSVPVIFEDLADTSI
ncbi:Imm74 family immunity protein [Aquimarina sp. AU58]|uniref:Imm74 family immunity protein n=1 Tax=Aquimarina sp. AU58 TaxID=1874112 RepID=UPI000D6E8D28|nr:Imm74 family immunity protein [Aquimarina sp. AU58]